MAVTPVPIGHPWWLDTPESAAREAWAVRSRGLPRYMTAIALLAAGSIATFAVNGAEWTATLAAVAKPRDGVPASLLAAYRVCAACWAVGESVSCCLTQATIEYEDLDRKSHAMRSSGIWRLQGLTQWAWLVIGAYFSLAGAISLRILCASDGDATHLHESGLVANVAVSLLELGWSYAIFVTVNVTFVLIPARARRGEAGAFYSHWGLVMHNANVGLMLGELLLDTLHISLAHAPLAPLFGLGYLTWHNTYRYARTRTLLYFTANWQAPRALTILLGLFLLETTAYALGWLACTLRESAAGCVALAVGARLIMRLRPMAIDAPPSKQARTSERPEARGPKQS